MAEGSLAGSRSPIIVTDSTCDLPADAWERYNIRRAPLKILFGEESYRSDLDMDLYQFAERMARGDVHPTSSQPTVPDFKALYESLAGAPILSIHLSAGLSGTVNAARQAAQALPDQDITVHDSGTISAALGLQVLTAARAAAAGYSTAQIVPLLEQTHTAGGLLFILDDLTPLVRGGRIGTVQYHVAQALHIKPLITVSKSGETAGTYVPAGRVRRLDKAVDAFVEQIVKEVGEGQKLRVHIVYGTDPTPTLADRLSEKLRQHFDCVHLERSLAGPILAVHTGTVAFDIGYAAGDWPV
ncbi:MAG: DegV family protein [Anaerolineae bacterium]|nr:DegV family protein [Anaerolineae bacterium]